MRMRLVLCVWICLLVSCREVQGFQPFSTSAPSFPSVKITYPPSSTLWGSNIQKPLLQTNRWWLNSVLEDGTSAIYPNPYRVTAQPTGLGVGSTSRVVTSTDINVVGDNQVILAAVETLKTHQVVAHDLLSVTIEWRSSQNNNNYLSAPLVRGMPYATQQYRALTPRFNVMTGIISVNGQQGHVGSVYTGTKFVVVSGDGKTWLLYSSTSISLKWQDVPNLVATGVFTGALRVACLTNASYQNIFDQYANAYPLSGTADFTVAGDVASITHSWKIQGTGDLLMMALPHHIDTLVNPQKTSLVINSMKGNTIGIVGTSWTMKENLPTTKWTNSKAPSQQYMSNILQNLKSDANYKIQAADVYNGGTELGRMGKLALIADELNQNDIANQIRLTIKNYLLTWLSGTNVDPLGYESVWGGLITKNNYNCSGCDYGNAWFNDHHFHYGYYLYAAAVVAKTDPAWVRQHLPPILDMARDIANPSPSDPYYPVFRHKDFYDGHSWASGLFLFNGGGDQESSSEAVNSYYGLYLLGEALGDTNMRDVGRVLLALEIRAAQKYWHMTSESDIYEQTFAKNKCVGRVWTTGVQYSTWFGANVEWIHLIQMLPFTSISEVLLTKSWIQEEYPVLATAFSRTSDPIQMAWRVYAYMAHAIIDPAAAAKEISALTSDDLNQGTGNSATNVWHWLATR